MISKKTRRGLVKADRRFAYLVEICGDIDVPLREAHFESLISSIIGQQLSGKVATVIWQRLVTFLKKRVTPKNVMAADTEALRGLGISYKKVEYIKNIAGAVLDKSLDLDNLAKYSDEEIIEQLTRIKGVGRWTAEMFLIFSLGREDVYSLGDGGLTRAVRNLYGMEKEPTKAQLAEISSRWSPYRTAASLYLWRSLDRDIAACIEGRKIK